MRTASDEIADEDVPGSASNGLTSGAARAGRAARLSVVMFSFAGVFISTTPGLGCTGSGTVVGLSSGAPDDDTDPDGREGSTRVSMRMLPMIARIGAPMTRTNTA